MTVDSDLIWYGMFVRDYLGAAFGFSDLYTFIDSVDGIETLIGPMYRLAFEKHGPPSRAELDLLLTHHLPRPQIPSTKLSVGQRLALALDAGGGDWPGPIDLARECYAADARPIVALSLGELVEIARTTFVNPGDLLDHAAADRYRAVGEYFENVMRADPVLSERIPHYLRYRQREAAVALHLYVSRGRPDSFPCVVPHDGDDRSLQNE